VIDCADVERCILGMPDPPYTAPLPDGRPPELGIIDDTLWYLLEVASEVIERLDNAEPVGDIIIALANRIQAETGRFVGPQITALVEAIAAMTAQQRADLIAVANWQETRSDAYCTGELTPITSTDYQNWLEWLADLIVDSLNSGSEWLISSLNNLAQQIAGESGAGLGFAGLSADGGGAGFGGTTPAACEEMLLTPSDKTPVVPTGHQPVPNGVVVEYNVPSYQVLGGNQYGLGVSASITAYGHAIPPLFGNGFNGNMLLKANYTDSEGAKETEWAATFTPLANGYFTAVLNIIAPAGNVTIDRIRGMVSTFGHPEIFGVQFFIDQTRFKGKFVIP
jgi:hypothetical protein